MRSPEAWRRLEARLRERAETDLPPHTPRPGDVARAVAGLVLGVLLMLVGVLLAGGRLVAGPRSWWEVVLGLAAVAASPYVVRYGLLAGEDR